MGLGLKTLDLFKYFLFCFLVISIFNCYFVSANALETLGKQSILIDFETGKVLFEKNADDPMPPSSMSKIMTIYKVFGGLQDGSLSLNDSFRVSEKAWKKRGSKMFVSLNSRVKVEDLIKGIIVQSGNDASIVVAEGLSGSEQAFADELNQIAKELAMHGTNFTNASGWPDPNHYTTARDLSILAAATIKDFPEFYHYYAQKVFTFNGIKQLNRNPVIYGTIGADGLKTGHTQAAGYGLTASAVRKKRRLVLVINGLPSLKSRRTESERILDWGFRVYNNYRLFSANDTVTQGLVWMGDKGKVPLVVNRDIILTLKRSLRKSMKVSVVFDEPIPAPIEKGKQLGLIRIELDGSEDIQFPVFSGAVVNQLSVFSRLGAAIKFILWGETG